MKVVALYARIPARWFDIVAVLGVAGILGYGAGYSVGVAASCWGMW